MIVEIVAQKQQNVSVAKGDSIVCETFTDEDKCTKAHAFTSPRKRVLCSMDWLAEDHWIEGVPIRTSRSFQLPAIHIFQAIHIQVQLHRQSQSQREREGEILYFRYICDK